MKMGTGRMVWFSVERDIRWKKRKINDDGCDWVKDPTAPEENLVKDDLLLFSLLIGWHI